MSVDLFLSVPVISSNSSQCSSSSSNCSLTILTTLQTAYTENKEAKRSSLKNAKEITVTNHATEILHHFSLKNSVWKVSV